MKDEKQEKLNLSKFKIAQLTNLRSINGGSENHVGTTGTSDSIVGNTDDTFGGQ